MDRSLLGTCHNLGHSWGYVTAGDMSELGTGHNWGQISQGHVIAGDMSELGTCHSSGSVIAGVRS